MKIFTNIVSSLEKCRHEKMPCDYPRLASISGLGGERINFQLILGFEDVTAFNGGFSLRERTDLKGFGMRQVKYVYTSFDTYSNDPSRGTAAFLGHPDKIYPDILEKMPEGNILRAGEDLISIWCDVEIPRGCGNEKHNISFDVVYKDEVIASDSIEVEFIGADLPEAEHICTNWFHVDCLADYYNVPIYSERHFEIIGNYIECAVKNGINTILTPVLTPPLDTEIGTYRKTVQLVDITLENGEYSFGFELLDKYISLCREKGVKYFEISHIFSQWGAKYAPKVEATVIENGKNEKKRIFGWDTPGTEGEYPRFLGYFIPALRAHLDELGITENCIFHVSDEPTLETLEGYKAAKNVVKGLMEGLKTVDACSHKEFFELGLMETPVPKGANMDDFLPLNIPERWTYYCCSWEDLAPNRMICYPSSRNRALGALMYKYNVKGFLQWAFNFYYDQGSKNLINPFTDMSGGGWVNSGDTFVVYPGCNGKPIESLRLAVFSEVFYDIRAMKKCEELCGREAVLALIDKNGSIGFNNYPFDNEYYILLRASLNEKIKDALAKKEDL
ncbi:MAG: DUF4091 domain-containing protein [Clostridia bacterium]|nr:DUF4091 domain-containing protein [Clostridia bacterium]